MLRTKMEQSGQNRENSKGNETCVFYKLFNVENQREQLDKVATTEGPVECFSLDEVKEQMAKIGKAKACEPDELSIEAVQMISEYNEECIIEVFNKILKKRRWQMTGERVGWYL